MIFILNDILNIEVRKGINIYLSDNCEIRDLFLSSFSLWFKTGVSIREDASFEVIKGNDVLKKNNFEVISIIPTIEDYLKPRSIKTQINNQLIDFIYSQSEVSDSLSKAIESIDYLKSVLNEKKRESNYTFSLPINVETDILSLLEYKYEPSMVIDHSILESKKSLIDLSVNTSKKEEIIIFIPFISLGLTKEEVKDIFTMLRDIDVYVIIFETNFGITQLVALEDNVMLIPNVNNSLDLIDMAEELSVVYQISPKNSLKHVCLIVDHYHSELKINYDLIKDYMDNYFVL